MIFSNFSTHLIDLMPELLSIPDIPLNIPEMYIKMSLKTNFIIPTNIYYLKDNKKLKCNYTLNAYNFTYENFELLYPSIETITILEDCDECEFNIAMITLKEFNTFLNSKYKVDNIRKHIFLNRDNKSREYTLLFISSEYIIFFMKNIIKILKSFLIENKHLSKYINKFIRYENDSFIINLQINDKLRQYFKTLICFVNREKTKNYIVDEIKFYIYKKQLQLRCRTRDRLPEEHSDIPVILNEIITKLIFRKHMFENNKYLIDKTYNKNICIDDLKKEFVYFYDKNIWGNFKQMVRDKLL